MAKWKLCFVLLLMLTVCFADKVTLVKTIGREPDATPICSNATLSTIILIVCKIRPEKSGVECLLQYGHGRDFVHECDYRFTLMMENQTVFLHLTSLTPVDSGTYTCECSHRDGTDILHLNITVEDVSEEEDTSSSTQMPIPNVLIGVTIVIMVAAVIFGFIYISIRQGQPKPPSSLPNTEPEDIEPYSIFIQRDNGLYSTTRVHVCNTNTDNSSMSTTVATH
ncbi:uncharacterized protein LOC119483720 isoform X1 [Sebastes umbrosus]|uniref:uncharacterized protein LOC119483720 isoform X1 n=1 Tax=Sebastes umbrosus TaxID=72105 RepID=UPI00189C6176|nr:uncharacterized protein LOC119483720 isoform X1 [Sebastes umbrosus]